MNKFIVSKDNDVFKSKTTEKINAIIIDFNEKFEGNLFFIITVDGKQVRKSSIGEFRTALDSGLFVKIPQIIEKDCIVKIKFEGFNEKFEIDNIHLYWNYDQG